MGDSTYSVRIEDEMKEKIGDLIKQSDLNAKDFMSEMVQTYEINKAKEVIPMLNQDLTELQTLTRRINSIYLSIGERIDTMTKAKDAEYRGLIDRKESIINTLQDKIGAIEELNSIMNTDVQQLKDTNDDLQQENINLKKQITEDADRFSQVNESNKALIEEYKGKIDTLTGIVEEYKGYKVEIEEIKKDLQDVTKQKEKLGNENIKLNDNIDRLDTDLKIQQKHHGEEIESIQDRMNLNKEKAILELQKTHQEEMKKIHEEYNAKVKSLLDEIEGDKKPIKKPAKKTTSKKKDTAIK